MNRKGIQLHFSTLMGVLIGVAIWLGIDVAAFQDIAAASSDSFIAVSWKAVAIVIGGQLATLIVLAWFMERLARKQEWLKEKARRGEDPFPKPMVFVNGRLCLLLTMNIMLPALLLRSSVWLTLAVWLITAILFLVVLRGEFNRQSAGKKPPA